MLQFETRVYGKWILVGEHAVLRGHPAIIFPVKNNFLHLKYWPSHEEIRAEFSGEFADEIQFLFWGALERAIEILNLQHGNLGGKVHIESNIPVGAGMGASAALCVALGRLFIHSGFLPETELLEFARELENLFHNESSGADIAVAIAQNGIYFSRNSEPQLLQPQWHPHWYLSYSDRPSTTSRCVKKVKELWQHKPEFAEQLDKAMATSVQQAKAALQLSAEAGLEPLIQAIQTAYRCFKDWQLCDGIIDKHIQDLTQAGALAAKPTGAGDGGFVISLWKTEPPRQLAHALIRV